MEEQGNQFEEKNEDLLDLDSKEIADPSAVEAVKKARKIGQQQFQTFSMECLVFENKAHCHEEAENRMLLHVSHVAQHGHRQMLIRTADTDVVVLAVFAINHLPAGCDLWLAFGTGKSFRYLAAHQIAASLGPEMSCALPMFHALTGCNTVSSFAGHGKKTA
ncbi:hypothetical protein NP493_242g03033 [Ridgeia piscesae]|uniref:Uncharacterized protein n=1 Tax=Ridgeia piscesae TaxID=27915 RepID=A0AAD9NYV6_RIDPI|nr:hypothetical protein NP493_242g03033 [Ridgeia piscesae]